MIIWVITICTINPGDWYDLTHLDPSALGLGGTVCFHVIIRDIGGLIDPDGDTHSFFTVNIASTSLPTLGDWYSGDTHYHSYGTENAVEFGFPVKATVEAGKSIGLDWVTITDHSFDFDSSMVLYEEEHKWSLLGNDCYTFSDSSLKCIRGEEVSAQNSDGKFVHLLAYDIPNYIEGEGADKFEFSGNERNIDTNADGYDDYPLTRDLGWQTYEASYEDVLTSIKNQGGFAYAAHPEAIPPAFPPLNRDKWQTADYNLIFDADPNNDYMGLEVWNTINEDEDRDNGLIRWVNLLETGLSYTPLKRVFISGGSDAHGDFSHSTHWTSSGVVENDNAFGKIRTYVYINGYSQSNVPPQNMILDALKNGQSMMTNGPIVVFTLEDTSGTVYNIGDIVSSNQNLDFTITVQGTPGEFTNNGVIYYTIRRGIEGGSEIPLILSDQLDTSNSYSRSHTFNVGTNCDNKKCYFRIEAWAGASSEYRAYTNPIWIDVSGAPVPPSLPDLSITSSDISWNPTSSQLSAIIHNIGVEPASNIFVEFYNGDPANNDLIGSDTITTITIGGSDTALVTWNNAPSGDQTVYAVIDSAHLGSGSILEDREDNNIASKTVNVPVKTTEVTTITVNPDPPVMVGSSNNIKGTITNNQGSINDARLRFLRAGPDRVFSSIIQTFDFSIHSADTTIEKDFNYGYPTLGQNFIRAELWNQNTGSIVSAMEKEVYVVDRDYELRAFLSSQLVWCFNKKSGEASLEVGSQYNLYAKMKSDTGSLPEDGQSLTSGLTDWDHFGMKTYNPEGNNPNGPNCLEISDSLFSSKSDGEYILGVIEDSNIDQIMDISNDRDGISDQSYYFNIYPLAPVIDSHVDNSEITGIVTITTSSKHGSIVDKDVTKMVFQEKINGVWTDIYTDNTPQDGFSLTIDVTNTPDLTQRTFKVTAYGMDSTMAESTPITLIVRSDIDTTPPTITSILHSPTNPTSQDNVEISADVSDNIGILEVVVNYSTDGVNYIPVVMTTTGQQSLVSPGIYEDLKGQNKKEAKNNTGKKDKQKVVVKYKSDKKPKKDHIEELKGKEVKDIKKLETVVVEVDDAEKFINEIKKDSDVLSVNKAVAYQSLLTPTDTFYPQQWNMENINAEGAWDKSVGTGITIAVIDTGVDYLHPDLDDNVILGYDWVNNDNDPMDDNGHGTHVAGIAAAELNGMGVVGTANGAKILAIKVLDSAGSGYDYNVASAIIEAADSGVDIISLSLGGGYSQVIEDSCNYAYDSGVLIVAAAGNNGGSVLYPAALDTVIAVSSVNSDNTISSFSSRGLEIELCAPGGGDRLIYSTYPGSGYAWAAGTSMAAPHVSGVAALLKSIHPDWTNVDIRNYMLSTARDLGTPGRDGLYGYGLIDASRVIGGPSLYTRATAAYNDTNVGLEVEAGDLVPFKRIKFSLHAKNDMSQVHVKDSFLNIVSLNNISSSVGSVSFENTEVETEKNLDWDIGHIKSGETYTLMFNVESGDWADSGAWIEGKVQSEEYVSGTASSLSVQEPNMEAADVQDLYKANIGNFPAGTTVNYYIFANDTGGIEVYSSVYSFSIPVDADGDGYDILSPGHPSDTDNLEADCNDNNPDINPGASESCNGVDDNCDGQVDEDIVCQWDGLIAKYHLDGYPIDSSGNDYHATIHGGAFFSQGISSDALYLDSADDYMEKDSSSFDPESGDYTVSLWLKPENYGTYQTIIGKRGPGEGWKIMLNNDNTNVYAYMQGGSCYGAHKMTKSGWNHLALVRSGNAFSLYINKNLVCSDSYSGAVSSGYPFRVGIDWDFYYPFYGSVDEVYIFNRALSETEVQVEYDRFAPDGLVAEYLFDGDTSDTSGNGIDATYSNADYVTGIDYLGIDFDSSNDHVDTTSSFFDAGNWDFSASLWIKPDTLGTYQTIIGKRGPGEGWKIMLKDDNSNILTYMGSEPCEGTHNMVSGWNYITLVRSGSTFNLYINTNLVCTGSYSDFVATSSPFRVGLDWDNYYPYDGSVDRVYIYNRVLTSAEMESEYSQYMP